MTQVTLPSGENTSGPALWHQVFDNDKALREVVNGEIDNANLSGSAGITAAKLASDAKPLTWYAPKIIATEETRENTAFGTLTTKDEITGIVLPTNGKLVVNFRAHVKSSVSVAGRIAVFIGATQAKNAVGAALEASTEETAFKIVRSGGIAFEIGAEAADATTGQLIGAPFEFFVAAGTYAVSVQYKATSGSITAKERKLWAEVRGF